MLAIDCALICDFTWRDFGVVTGQANSEEKKIPNKTKQAPTQQFLRFDGKGEEGGFTLHT